MVDLSGDFAKEKKLEEQGDPTAQFEYAQKLENAGHIGEAIIYYIQAADQDDINAISRMMTIDYNGILDMDSGQGPDSNHIIAPKHERALKYCDRLIQLAPDDPELVNSAETIKAMINGDDIPGISDPTTA